MGSNTVLSRVDPCFILSGFAPHTGEPRLLSAWQTGRAVIVFEFVEARIGHPRTPCREGVVGTVTPVAPALLIVAARV